jgi:transcriptional regulator with XRE-family HTH domain
MTKRKSTKRKKPGAKNEKESMRMRRSEHYRDDLIRLTMAVKGLSDRELAAMSALTLNSVNAVRNGRIDPRVSTLRRVAIALGLKPKDLLDDDIAIGWHIGHGFIAADHED